MEILASANKKPMALFPNPPAGLWEQIPKGIGIRTARGQSIEKVIRQTCALKERRFRLSVQWASKNTVLSVLDQEDRVVRPAKVVERHND